VNQGSFFFSSESVTEGHPDKLADQISDAVLDAIIELDPSCRVACETLLTTGLVVVAGEITTHAYVEVPDIVRRTLQSAGYTRAKYGLDCQTCGVMTSIQKQSPDIALGVNTGGAGDQGMMFGYATDETPEMMPMPIMLAHKLARQLAQVRKENTISYLRPDGKSQVTVEYRDGCPVRIDKVLVSAQHEPTVPLPTITADVLEHVVKPILPPDMVDERTKYFVNPTGSGGMARHGGGAFSGKDPTKVDRSAAYMMRYVAKNIVAAGLARRCELQVAYAIGEKEPLSVMVATFGTGKLPERDLERLVLKYFDLTPGGIIKHLGLCRPIYQQTAAYGHFGRTDLHVPWEETDMADTLTADAGR
jgi:S-adenosylmethionine synthetase